ncbi:MAG: hypothetical protein ACYCU7_16630 [Acidimicrobiales bacterium]
MMDDIRGVDAEHYREELRRRWGALLSYRYIGRQFSSMNTVADAPVALRHDMRNAVGGIMAAPLAIICPGGGMGADLETVPNPVVHSLQLVDDARGVRRVEVVDEVDLKRGQRLGFGRALIVDADDHDRVIALVESQGASIGQVPPGMTRFDDDPVEHIEDSPDLPPLSEVFGAARRDDGHWTLPELRAELASPDAALHLGPQHVVLERAAGDLAEALAGTHRLQVDSVHVMFLSRGKVGPFRVDGRALGDAGRTGRVGVQLTLHDEGAGDRAVTAASYVFGVAGG